jgi:hypothetical protein
VSVINLTIGQISQGLEEDNPTELIMVLIKMAIKLIPKMLMD